MRKFIIISLLISILFIAGCSNYPATGEFITNTVASTSTAASSIPKEVTTVFSTNPDTCPKQFLRRQVNPDGSVREYCLPPEYFNLKSCNVDKDCSAAETCINGYCIIHDEDIIA